MARTARNRNRLVSNLHQAAGGAKQHAATIPLLQNPEAAILATLEFLMGRPAAPDGSSPMITGVDYQWNTAKGAKLTANTQYRATLAAGRTLALACVNALKNALSRQWSFLWEPVGFGNGSLRIPRNPVMTLIRLGNYYASHPSLEVPNVAGIDCTAAACRAAAQAILVADSARNSAGSRAVLAKREYLAGIKAARQRLIGLRAELAQLLKPNDPRWLSFGLEKPAYRATPAVPEDLTSHAAGSGAVRYEWADSPRADNYRFVLKDSAGNVLFERLTNENSITITDIPSLLRGFESDEKPSVAAKGQGEGSPLPVGLAVTGEVSARNKTGESRPTAPVSAKVG